LLTSNEGGSLVSRNSYSSPEEEDAPSPSLLISKSIAAFPGAPTYDAILIEPSLMGLDEYRSFKSRGESFYIELAIDERICSSNYSMSSISIGFCRFVLSREADR
jgi:hypothetical protein